jgi:hypothetical protein
VWERQERKESGVPFSRGMSGVRLSLSKWLTTGPASEEKKWDVMIVHKKE